MAEAAADTTKAPIDVDVELRKRRLSKMKADRGTLNSHLEEIAEVIFPNGMGFTGTRTAGEKRMTRVFDSTGITSNRLMAASMHGLATNPASKWFSLRMVAADLNEQKPVKDWTSQLEKRMYAEMYAPGTNITPCLNEFYLELGAFGTAIFFIGETSKGGLLFQSKALARSYIAENSDDVIDTVYTCYPYTVRQIMEDPAWAPNASKKVKDLFEKKKYDDVIEVCHAVEPRPNAKGRGKKNMPFASVYFEVETCTKLEEGGFPEFPYVVARWSKAAGEIYGRSPGMEALPDVKMLQAMMCETIKIMQKMAKPVRWLNAQNMEGTIRDIPGATNYWRGNPSEGIYLEPTTDKLPITLSEMDNLRNRIRTIFNNDTLQITDQREMTLGEAQMRRTERMRLQGPNIGRLDSEMLGPMTNRVYGILSRRGKVPTAPQEIDNQQVTVEFVSPLANAQKQEQLAGLSQAFQYLTPLGELAASALKKKLNPERLVDYLWDVLNNDPELLNTEDEMKQIAASDAQQQNIAASGPMADAASKGAGAIKQLADANAGGGIDMNKLMSAVGPTIAARANAGRPQ